eukprot:scaffold194131_cov20-Tisochrysis_lutea.AAC.1
MRRCCVDTRWNNVDAKDEVQYHGTLFDARDEALMRPQHRQAVRLLPRRTILEAWVFLASHNKATEIERDVLHRHSPCWCLKQHTHPTFQAGRMQRKMRIPSAGTVSAKYLPSIEFVASLSHAHAAKPCVSEEVKAMQTVRTGHARKPGACCEGYQNRSFRLGRCGRG